MPRGQDGARRARLSSCAGSWWASPIPSRRCIFVVVLFITPLLLAARMSLSTWGLLTGEARFNFPKNFAAIAKNQLFWPSVVVHARIHRARHRAAARPGPRARPAGAGAEPLGQSAAHGVPAAGVAGPRGRVAAGLRLLLAGDRADRAAARGARAGARHNPVPRHAAQRAAVDDLPRSSGSTPASTC